MALAPVLECRQFLEGKAAFIVTSKTLRSPIDGISDPLGGDNNRNNEKQNMAMAMTKNRGTKWTVKLVLYVQSYVIKAVYKVVLDSARSIFGIQWFRSTAISHKNGYGKVGQ